MSSSRHTTTPRVASSNLLSSSRTTNEGQKFIPAVGETWPELKDENVIWPDGDNCVGIHYKSIVNQTGRTQSFTIGLKLKTRVFVIFLLIIVASYAACKDDSTLMSEVVKAITPHHASESPPKDRTGRE